MPRPFVEYLTVAPSVWSPEVVAMPRLVPEPVEILNAFQAISTAASDRKPFLLLPADYTTTSPDDLAVIEKAGVIVGRRSQLASDPWRGFAMLNGPDGDPWHLLPAPTPGRPWPHLDEMAALVVRLTPTLKSNTGRSRILKAWHVEQYFEKVMAEVGPDSRPERMLRVPDAGTPEDRSKAGPWAHWLMTHLHAKPGARWTDAEDLAK